MSSVLTRKMLLDWAGAKILRDAETLVENGLVLEASFDMPTLQGSILRNNRPLSTSLTVNPDGTVENHCPCYDNRERGLICAHVIALGVVIVRRGTDPQRDLKYKEELRRASRLAALDESAYIRRVPADTAGALPASLRLTLCGDWQAGFAGNAVRLKAELVCRDEAVELDAVPRDQSFVLDRRDEALLFVLEDISEGPAAGRLEVGAHDLLNIVQLLAGASLFTDAGETITVNQARMTTHLQIDLDRENGELLVFAHTELPFMDASAFPVHLVAGRSGWVYGAGNLWPLGNLLPDPYHAVYREPIVIARPDVLRFLRQELPVLERGARIETDLSPDLFTIDPGEPRFLLTAAGSPASLSAVLRAVYGPYELVAAKPSADANFSLPDAEDLLRYTVRNEPAEREALARLAAFGLRGPCGDDLTDIVGERNVLNFLGSALPSLRRHGWRVELEGRVAPFLDTLASVTPVVHVDQEDGGTDWFDVGFTFEDTTGATVSPADVQLAIRRGESFVTRDGHTMLLDRDAVETMMDVFSDCESSDGQAPGHFRLASVYAAFIKTSLDAIDGVDIEDSPAWRKFAMRTGQRVNLEPVTLPAPLDGTLRRYQKDGVAWLRFLERAGFCGLLADEMGLGKTVQALAWLQLQRASPEAADKPALVVCPTSLVENWAEEAARFTPELRVVVLSGPDRHEHWPRVERADLAVTSYALLRRDLDQCLERTFSAVILDEAQHIKNRATQNAQSAKQLKAHHRLVLTGTPMENSVSDLWSILDFLMPGYLGRHDAFREHYERPIARGGADAERAQAKLRRKLQPFLLRRLKKDVARDLPPKIERIAHCDLSSDQRVVYQAYLEESRNRINTMVTQRGFNRCRMEVLTTLMRLRQICCHLDLVKLPDLNADAPSAKLDLFNELLDEAIDSGHRVLVFSQFVSMLQILRAELDTRGVAHCYMDGSTKERLEVVHTFNAERSIPVFLISLKAGGTGLNLTGADMVVHFDPWWNPAVENQATDRAYRIGQKRTVYSVKLITRNTVEEKVLALQARKKQLIDATVESDEEMITSFSWEDVQELLA